MKKTIAFVACIASVLMSLLGDSSAAAPTNSHARCIPGTPCNKAQTGSKCQYNGTVYACRECVWLEDTDEPVAFTNAICR